VGSLPSGQAVVDTAGEAVGLQLGYQLLAHLGDQPPDCRLLLVGEVEQAGDVPPGDDEHMAFCGGKGIGERHRAVVLQTNAACFWMTKWAALWLHFAVLRVLPEEPLPPGDKNGLPQSTYRRHTGPTIACGERLRTGQERPGSQISPLRAQDCPRNRPDGIPNRRMAWLWDRCLVPPCARDKPSYREATLLTKPPPLPSQVLTAILRDLLLSHRGSVPAPGQPVSVRDWTTAVTAEL
jgi:hypothetical protein